MQGTKAQRHKGTEGLFVGSEAGEMGGGAVGVGFFEDGVDFVDGQAMGVVEGGVDGQFDAFGKDFVFHAGFENDARGLGFPGGGFGGEGGNAVEVEERGGGAAGDFGFIGVGEGVETGDGFGDEVYHLEFHGRLGELGFQAQTVGAGFGVEGGFEGFGGAGELGAEVVDVDVAFGQEFEEGVDGGGGGRRTR